MSTLVWDRVGDKTYETGISKGVLYKSDGDGVPWNGLVSIDVGNDTGVEAVYFDGVKFNDVVTVGDFQAKLKAYTYPEEFLYYEGTIKDQTGFYLTGQRPSRFGLSYQTKVGDDVGGTESGYKIHLLYNLTAVPSDTTYETMSLDASPIEFEWDLTAVPEEVEFFRPTAHVILDSRTMDESLLRDVEDILYGNEEHGAHLPRLQALATFLRGWQRLIITDNGDGTWTATSTVPGVITMLDSETFQIDSDAATVVDPDTYTITSTDKNEDDLWLP